MKSKTLLQLLQQQQSNQEDHSQNNSNHLNDLKGLIEQGDGRRQSEGQSVPKLQKQIFDLFMQMRVQIIESQDQTLICQLRRMIPPDRSSQELLQQLDFQTLLTCIGFMFNAVLQEKQNLEKYIEQKASVEQSDYEQHLQKLEAEIRQHIRIEQQLKLYAENTQAKLEEVSKMKEDLDQQFLESNQQFEILNDKSKKQQQRLKQYEQEIQHLRNEVTQTKMNNNVVLAKKDQNKHEEQMDYLQRPIMVNLQLDRIRQEPKSKLENRTNDIYERIQTEPALEIDKHNSTKKNPKQAGRVATEMSEQQKRAQKRQQHLSYFEMGQFQNPQMKKQHNRVKTQNFLNQTQEMRRHQSNKTYQDILLKNKEVNRQRNNPSQHSAEFNRSNNSVHSFRMQQKHQNSSINNTLEIIQLPRPFSSIEQFDDTQVGIFNIHSEFQEYCDFYPKQMNEFNENQIINKLLTNYQKQNENQPPKFQKQSNLSRNKSRDNKRQSYKFVS